MLLVLPVQATAQKRLKLLVERVPSLQEKLDAFRRIRFAQSFSKVLLDLKEGGKAEFEADAEKISQYFFNFLDTVPTDDNLEEASSIFLRGLKKKKANKEKKKKKKK